MLRVLAAHPLCLIAVAFSVRQMCDIVMLPWTCETLPLQCSEVELGPCCSCTVGRRPASSMPRGFFPSRARWLSPRTHLLGAWYATRLIFAGKSTAICAASSFTQSSAPCQVHVARPRRCQMLSGHKTNECKLPGAASQVPTTEASPFPKCRLSWLLLSGAFWHPNCIQLHKNVSKRGRNDIEEATWCLDCHRFHVSLVLPLP